MCFAYQREKEALLLIDLGIEGLDRLSPVDEHIGPGIVRHKDRYAGRDLDRAFGCNGGSLGVFPCRAAGSSACDVSSWAA